MSDIQSQSVEKCADLRQKCQREIFEKMDKQHTVQMNAMSDIKEEIAFRKGREEALAENVLAKYMKRNGNGTASVPNAGISSDTREILIKILINWGPWIGLALILGVGSILKSKGWL